MLVQRLLQQGGIFFDAMTQPEATAVYGNYTSRAVSMFNLPPVLVYPISCSIIPLISAARGQNDTKRVKTIMESSLRTAVLIGAPCALGMCALAKPILSLFFTGSDAIELATPLLQLLARLHFLCVFLPYLLQFFSHAEKNVFRLSQCSAVQELRL